MTLPQTVGSNVSLSCPDRATRVNKLACFMLAAKCCSNHTNVIKLATSEYTVDLFELWLVRPKTCCQLHVLSLLLPTVADFDGPHTQHQRLASCSCVLASWRRSQRHQRGQLEPEIGRLKISNAVAQIAAIYQWCHIALSHGQQACLKFCHFQVMVVNPSSHCRSWCCW